MFNSEGFQYHVCMSVVAVKTCCKEVAVDEEVEEESSKYFIDKL